MMKNRLLWLSVTIFLAAIIVWFLHLNDLGETYFKSSQGSSMGMEKTQPIAISSSAIGPSEKDHLESDGNSNGNLSTPIFSQLNLYPFLMRMHSARVVGSWASGDQLLHECIKAATLLDPFFLQHFTNGEVTDPVRLEAKSKLQTRCMNMPEGILNQYEPRSDDENAQKYRATKLFLFRRQFSNREQTVDAVRELARQGKLEEVKPFLIKEKIWNGEEWKGDESDFSQMVNAAAELATAEPGSEKDDLRLIQRCYFNGRCDYQYGTIREADTPAETARRQKIVQEMADAMRRGDVDRILSIKH